MQNYTSRFHLFLKSEKITETNAKSDQVEYFKDCKDILILIADLTEMNKKKKILARDE